MPDSPVKGQVSVEIGKKSVDKLVDAVVDVFSPGTEFLGALGDAVRLGRVEMAAKITRRAGQIAEDGGLTLKAPPLKFLVPFYEKASIEDDPRLEEMWANLLATTGTKNGANNTLYLTFLSRLSGAHAHLLSALCHHISCRNPRPSHNFLQIVSAGNIVKDILPETFSEDAEEEIKKLVDRLYYYGYCARMLIITQANRSKNDKMNLFAFKLDANNNVMIFGNAFDSFVRTSADSQEYLWEALISNNLVELRSFSVPISEDKWLSGDCYCITRLGSDFINNCSSDKVRYI